MTLCSIRSTIDKTFVEKKETQESLANKKLF